MIIATHPGRHGDILWALPTCRALADGYGEPIHLRLSQKYGSDSFCALLRTAPYLASVEALEGWQIEESAPIGPRVPPAMRLDPEDRAEGYSDRRIYHLGYDGWPHPTLPEDVYLRTLRQYRSETGRELPALELQRPWLRARTQGRPPVLDVAIGFTDEHFELKFGVTTLLLNAEALLTAWVIAAPGSRWEREACHQAQPWEHAAQIIDSAGVFFGDCSALHVLAVALGTPCVLLEPNPQRWHDGFWPLGKDGRVQIVRGGDGQPTWDSRHCAEAIGAALTALAAGTTGGDIGRP